MLPKPPSAAAPAPPAPADIEALIAVLQDPAARDRLVAQLRALSAAAPAEKGEDAIGDALASVNQAIEQRVDVVSSALVDLVTSVRQIPILVRWTWLQLSEPISRELWWSITLQAGTAVLAGFAASLVVRRLLRGWRDRLGALPLAARSATKVKASLACLAVDLAALLTFLVVTYLALAYGDVSLLARRVAGDVLIAIACARSLTALGRALLAAKDARRRLLPLADAAARRAERWVSLLTGLSFYGYFGLRVARTLGLPWTVHGFLLHVLLFTLVVLVITLIYRLRTHVAGTIERWGRSSTSVFARFLPWQMLAAAGHHLLAVWVALVFVVWAVGVQDGAMLLTRGLAVTVAAILAVRAFNLWLDWTILPPRPEAVEEGEEIETRPAAQMALVTLLRSGVGLVALALVLQAWGIDVAGWLQTQAGRAVLGSIGRIGIIVAVVAVAAKSVQVVAARYIEATDAEGNLIYSNRTRTLVSMARNLAVTLLFAVGIVEVLAELGVNTNALLAGAGVVGLAIGFGSQKLVQDLITGLFILVGDTVRVGDVVDLGGKAGVIEAISMRTITLRDYNGNVHTIPYSSIDVVTNMTKDFSFAVFDVGVAYKEDTDQVVEVLREIDSQLRREWPYRRLILEPIEIAGVDAFRESAVIVKARSKVRAGEQWKVAREFNRRLKKRFDELGIEIPFPHRTVYFGGSRSDRIPPEPIEALRNELLARRASAEG
ncbi:mechanosensitive ion channel domain-containing protein [Benzoatithermus flavus]|uniref:Mechanosensitive ion channel domain-containing protein n=1 Tax=Benzoatithermus flavus TaxID=3108223 RepID=A0ABU8XRD9_9PROT